MDNPGDLGDEEFGYDNYGNQLWKRDGKDIVTLYKYDVLNREQRFAVSEPVSTSGNGHYATGADHRAGRLLCDCVGILVAACLLGLLTNAGRPDRLPWIRQRISESRTTASGPLVKTKQATFITLADAKPMYDSGEALFVDARHELDYKEAHITGAKLLYYDEVEKHYPSAVGDIPKDKPIVVYCYDPECESAISAGDALVARGHTRVYILIDCLPGWEFAGYPVTRGGGQ